MPAFVYILRCSDDSYYVGLTHESVDKRVGEHNDGLYDGYTKSRRPVTLVYAHQFDRITDAIAAERQLNGWSRAKKAALIKGDFNLLKEPAKRRT